MTTTRTVRPAYVLALRSVCELIEAGASPATVASFVLCHQGDVRTFVSLSHMIEDQAHDGTFAAAVFDILAN